MKNIMKAVAIFALLFTGLSFTKICDPARTPFQEIIREFNHKENIAVEGYFVDEYKFLVTRSSDTQIQKGKTFDVFEYGPFGSRCEDYAMQASAPTEIHGKNKLRLLILLKNLSKNGKLMTDIFHGTGIEMKNNSQISYRNHEYDQQLGSHLEYEYSASSETIRKKLFNDDRAKITWTKKLVKNK